MTEQKVQRIIHTVSRLDNRTDPPSYVDEVLPTFSKKVFARAKQGTAINHLGSEYTMGSLMITGSYYETTPGTYSYRVTRRSFMVGSYSRYANIHARWALVHSREGTVDLIDVIVGTLNAQNRGPLIKHFEVLGGPLNPVYSFGPGTLWNRVSSRQGTVRVASSLEGYVG